MDRSLRRNDAGRFRTAPGRADGAVIPRPAHAPPFVRRATRDVSFVTSTLPFV